MRFWKAFVEMVQSRAHGITQLLLPNSRYDYKRSVGDGLEHSVLMAPVTWMTRQMPQAELVIKDGEELIREHPALDLLHKPNPHYGLDELVSAVTLSLAFDGNGYIAKVMPNNQVEELWYIPHWLIEPTWQGNEFISGYRYSPTGAGSFVMPPECVIHIRTGIDPRNTRKGYGALSAVTREAFTDEEAANYTAALLRNMGVPGLLISPEKGETADPGDLAATKEYLKQRFTGDRRGEPMIMGGATKVTQLAFNPEQLNLGKIRNIPEERVCSMLGIPAAVVGFGTGLQQTKVGATMNELKRMAWTDGIMPMQRVIAAGITRSLLPDFGLRPQASAWFDTTNVIALQEDKREQAEVMDRLVKGGIITVAEAREKTGFTVEPQHEVFLRPINAIEIPANEMQSDFSEDLPPAEDQAAGARPGASKQGPRRFRLNRVQSVIVRGMDRVRRIMEPALERRMMEFFVRFGKQAGEAFLEIVGEKGWNPAEMKQDEDELIAEQVFRVMDIEANQSQLRGVFGAHFIAVHDESIKVITGAGIAVNIPDPVQIEILSTGAKRSRLVNLTRPAKERVFQVIAEARADGLGAAEVAKRLEEVVPRGRFRDSRTRAKVIARTETLYAQNDSTIRAYRSAGMTQLIVLDARFGPTDEFCESINGNTIDMNEADFLRDEEHPNGSRSFAPVFTR